MNLEGRSLAGPDHHWDPARVSVSPLATRLHDEGPCDPAGDQPETGHQGPRLGASDSQPPAAPSDRHDPVSEEAESILSCLCNPYRSLLTVLSAPEPLEDSVPFSPHLGSQGLIKVPHGSPQRRHPEKEIHPHPSQLLRSNRQAGSSPPGVHGPPTTQAPTTLGHRHLQSLQVYLCCPSDTGVKARSWHYMSRS